MKTIISTALLSLLSLCTSAQLFESFGVISDEEVKMTRCSFDPDAEAIVLLHEAESYYDDEYKLITIHHYRIKLFTDKAVEQASVSLPYWRKEDFEQLRLLKAVTYNYSAPGQYKIAEVDKKAVFDRKINERIGELAFSLPEAKKGSILEYSYESIMRHYGGLDEWLFQQELPTVKSSYKLQIVPNTEFAYRVEKAKNWPIVVKPSPGDGKIYFEMNNIPGLRDEPYMDARKDYLQRVTFQLSKYQSNVKYMTNWDELNREMYNHEDFGRLLGKKIDNTEQWIGEVKLYNSDTKKLEAVYNHVRNNMSWNYMYSKFASEGLKKPWEKKNGASGEMNLLLINLLKQAGLEVYPALVSHRKHGLVNKNYPFLDQFNSVVACVKINGLTLFVDAVAKEVPYHMVSAELLNTTAFVIDKKKGSFFDIINDTLMYNETITLNGTLDETGELKGNAIVQSKDYARLEKLLA
jgi:hypothetical protein